MIAKLQPNRVRRTYRGGGRIDAFTSFSPVSDGALRPEDWLASTTTAFNGVVEIEGEGLGRLEDGRLVRDAFGALPILVKLLDSDERLVVQAHPTVPFARAYMNSPVGKTECWYFLPGTAADACVYLGFRPGITRESWREAVGADHAAMGTDPAQQAVRSARLLEKMHRVPVRAGDLVFVDGGVPHAIGAGCFMIELQEPSDLMVVAERFTPSGREIPEAKLHGSLGWSRMFDVYAYEGVSFDELCRRYVRRGADATDVKPAVRCVVGRDLTDKFEEWVLNATTTRAARLDLSGAASVIVVTEGAGTLNGLSVGKGDRLVATGEQTLELVGAAEAVCCFSADFRGKVGSRMVGHGDSRKVIPKE